jgi:hypothetical protein
MKALGKLDQLWGSKPFSDGTVIKVASIFAQDYVEIITSGSVLSVISKCNITFFNVPEVVQPMRLPGLIGRGQSIDRNGFTVTMPVEVLGKDYIKTYYEFSSNCSLCDDLDFSVCDTEELANEVYAGYTGELVCLPFTFDNATNINANGDLRYPDVLHYIRPASVVAPYFKDPLAHCIYSFWGCQAEIIETGKDEGGTFILWKAYTEWSRLLPLDSSEISRTGLGFMEWRGFQKNKNGSELCTSDRYVTKVDCCVKDLADRHIHLWWERTVFCDFMFYRAMKVCEIPARTLGYYEFVHYAEAYGGGIWTLADVHGTCIPFEWKMTGPGHLHLAEPFAHWGSYDPDPLRYTEPKCEPVVITIKDRCGTEREIRADCCETQELGVLGIGYTELIMTVDEEQDLYNSGGCPPYQWSLSGVGTLEDVTTDPTVGHALFTAPAEITNCSENSVITITDCCGKTASITIWVREYYPGTTAYWITEQATCSACENPPTHCSDWWPGATKCFKMSSCARAYDCSGTIIDSHRYYYGTPEGWHTVEDLDPGPCSCAGADLWGAMHVGVDCDSSCIQIKYCGGIAARACNLTYDVRTTAMKEHGCCPPGLS